MNDKPPSERQEALLIVLVALLLVGASWLALGKREPAPPPPNPPRPTAQP